MKKLSIQTKQFCIVVLTLIVQHQLLVQQLICQYDHLLGLFFFDVLKVLKQHAKIKKRLYKYEIIIQINLQSKRLDCNVFHFSDKNFKYIYYNVRLKIVNLQQIFTIQGIQETGSFFTHTLSYHVWCITLFITYLQRN